MENDALLPEGVGGVCPLHMLLRGETQYSTGQLLQTVRFQSAVRYLTQRMCVRMSNLRSAIAEGPAGFQTEIAASKKNKKGLCGSERVATGSTTAEKIRRHP